MSRTAPRRWVGVDGEGVGCAPHRYVLLAGSDEKGNASHVEDYEGLTTNAALDWFLQWAKKDVRLCGYFLQYDWTKILSDMPNRSLYRLFRPELRAIPSSEGGGFSRVSYGKFKVHWLGGAMHLARGEDRVTVWDLGKFYQQSFVKSLRDWTVGTPAVVDRIEAMKARRATFAPGERDEIRGYCLDECRALAELARTLSEAHDAVGIRPAAWHGPGSTAGAVLRREGVAAHRGRPPPEAGVAVSTAFFGGRFEHSEIGRVSEVWEYDIASAYPYAMTLLPCLAHARWEMVKGAPPPEVRWALTRASVTSIGVRRWGPLPIRIESGTIVWPRGDCSGWYWSPELRAAIDGWPGAVVAHESWLLHEECACSPFEWVLPMYRQRLELGKNVKGRVLKLALNSCYGQFARTVGGGGRFSSRTWAGMVTATTRGQLLALMASADDAVIGVATDGVYSRRRLATPPPPMGGDSLGSWEEKLLGPVTFVRPGIFYGDEDVVRARGVGRSHLESQRALITRAIGERSASVYLGWSDQFGGAKVCVWQARGAHRRSTVYGEWHRAPARISLLPGPKRAHDWAPPPGLGRESLAYRPGKTSQARVAEFVEALKDGKR